MNAFQRYIVEEHVEDFNDHLISRRELIRRVTFITGSVAGTIALLEAMACGQEPAGSPASPSRPTRGSKWLVSPCRAPTARP